MKVCSVILARGGSKGIPRKNIIDLNGKPLIAYTIIASINSNTDETWVCTDDEEIASVSKKYGANVLMRPSELATDTSRSEDALLFFANKINFDILLFIQPTSPLLTHEYINKGIDMLINNKFDSVFSAYKEHWLPRWVFNNKITPYEWQINNRPRRQDIEYKWVENGAFYLTTKNNLQKNKLRYNYNVGIVEMPFSKSFQVDTIDDLEIIKKLI